MKSNTYKIPGITAEGKNKNPAKSEGGPFDCWSFESGLWVYREPMMVD